MCQSALLMAPKPLNAYFIGVRVVSATVRHKRFCIQQDSTEKMGLAPSRTRDYIFHRDRPFACNFCLLKHLSLSNSEK